MLTLCTIYCDCEKGTMFKTAIRNEKGEQVMFGLVHDKDKHGHFNSLVFQGYCSGCGKKFEFALQIESLLNYREV